MSEALGNLKLWWVTAVEVPTKRGDWRGKEPKILIDPPILVCAEDKQQAAIRAVAKTGLDISTNRVKVFICPFEDA